MSSTVEPREGMVTVYDSDGQYLGCMGIETWNGLLEERSAPPEGHIIPEGDERCAFTMDACTCMKRTGHDGLHACAHGDWRAANSHPEPEA